MVHQAGVGNRSVGPPADERQRQGRRGADSHAEAGGRGRPFPFAGRTGGVKQNADSAQVGPRLAVADRIRAVGHDQAPRGDRTFLPFRAQGKPLADGVLALFVEDEVVQPVEVLIRGGEARLRAGLRWTSRSRRRPAPACAGRRTAPRGEDAKALAFFDGQVQSPPTSTRRIARPLPPWGSQSSNRKLTGSPS